MKYLLKNPNTDPVVAEYLDGIKVSSITNRSVYGYLCQERGVIVPEPGYYAMGGQDNVKIDEFIGEECTEQFLAEPFIVENPFPEDSEVSASSTTYGDYVYFAKCIITRDESTSVFYTLFSADGENIQDAFFVGEDNALYIGTYNLENGTSVEIVAVSPTGVLIDSDNIQHSDVFENEYTYFTVPGHETLYISDMDGTVTKLPNGKYHLDGVDSDIPVSGYIFAFGYNLEGTYVSERHLVKSRTEFDEPITVIGSGGTPETTTGTGIIYYKDGQEVYSVYKNRGYWSYNFYTGTTWDNLAWYGGSNWADNVRYYKYTIQTYKSIPTRNVVSTPVPSVALSGGKVYYNEYPGIPIYCGICEMAGNGFLYMIKDQEMVFDSTFKLNIDVQQDLDCGSIDIYPQQVERLWFDDVDKTEEFKNGTIESVNVYRRLYRMNGTWSTCQKMKVLFEEEFFKTGILYGYPQGCQI